MHRYVRFSYLCVACRPFFCDFDFDSHVNVMLSALLSPCMCSCPSQLAEITAVHNSAVEKLQEALSRERAESEQHRQHTTDLQRQLVRPCCCGRSHMPFVFLFICLLVCVAAISQQDAGRASQEQEFGVLQAQISQLTTALAARENDVFVLQQYAVFVCVIVRVWLGCFVCLCGV